MPEFAEFKQNALDLPRRLMRSYSQSTFCMGFFTSLLPGSRTMQDAQTIKLLVDSLCPERDSLLPDYVKIMSPHKIVDANDFQLFKCKVLTGIYLFMWSHYNSIVENSVYSSLIDLFRHDLGINSPAELSDKQFHDSLESLSRYASFIYENRESAGIYNDLNLRLGVTIQADIVMARTSKRASVSSLYTMCAGMLCSIGMNNMS